MENHFQKISRDNKMKISVIIPVYNEEESINHCLNALINQNFPKKNYEIIIINDGSTDKTKENIEKIIINNSKANIKLINQKNKGRALTREIGAKKAKYENLLFTDARCKAEKNLLKNTSLTNEQCIVGNPLINQENWFGRFGYLLRKKLYKKSFYNFNQIYLTKSNFDHISKGTTILFIKKSLFLSSKLKNQSSKNNSDDTKLLWNVILKSKILKSPHLKVTYSPRSSIKKHIAHTFNRGPKFIDYYFSPGKKYFPHIILLILIIIFAVILSIIYKQFIIYFFIFSLLTLVIISTLLSEKLKDFWILITFIPITSISFIFGLMKGLILKLIGKN
jgi:glycosyltransferase involved in cell wall biosynthesis